MKSSGLFHIGRDAEIRYLPNGDAVANVSLAFNFGKRAENGDRSTQWIEGALFGQRAETLAPMLLKGSQHVFHLTDVHIETYPKNDGGEGHKLVGRIDDVELTDRRDDHGGQQQGNQQRQQPQRQAPQGNGRAQGGGQQGNGRGQGNQQRPAPPQRQAPARSGAASDGFNNMDDDIPWATSSMHYDMTTSKSRRMARNEF